MMIRTVFDKVSIHGEKTVKCAGGCGRRLKRRQEFYQTINPFNKNKTTGLVKTSSEIYPELNAEREKWMKEPETCIHCPEPKR